MNRTASVQGAWPELARERRLLELGYRHVLRPSRMDHAVDFCVWTAKGWLGVQVKTVRTGRGFYVIPVDEIAGERRIRAGRLHRFWQAWGRVLGEPASVTQARRRERDDDMRQGALFAARLGHGTTTRSACRFATSPSW